MVYVGIDIGGTKMMIVGSTSPNQENVESMRFSTGSSCTPDQIKTNVQTFISLKFPESAVESLGIAVCGLLDDRGTIVICEIPPLNGWNPMVAIKELLLITHNRTKSLNDAEAAVLHVKHQYYDQPKDKHSNIVVLVVGTGIGTGLILDGKHIKGWAGCFGTAPLGVNQKTLDELAGGRSILKNIAPSTPEQLIHALNNGASNEQEKKAVEVVMEAANALGVGISILLNLLNPSLIVVAGGVLNFPGYFQEAVKAAEKNTHIVPELFSNCTIVESKYRNELVAMGTLIAPLL